MPATMMSASRMHRSADGARACWPSPAVASRASPTSRIEIFDAHLHYNWEPKPYLPARRGAGAVQEASRHRHSRHQPAEHRHPCADGRQGEGRSGVCRSCRSSGRTASAPISAAGSTIPCIFDLVQDEFKRGYYRGVGEFHLSAARPPIPRSVKKTVDFAVANNLYLHAHADDEAVEILMRHNPRAQIIWAHTGFSLCAASASQRCWPNIRSCGASCPIAAASSTGQAS